MKTCDRCGNEYADCGAAIIADTSAVVRYYCGDCWSGLERMVLCEKAECCRTSDTCRQDDCVRDGPEIPNEVTLTAEEYERLAPMTIVAGRLE